MRDKNINFPNNHPKAVYPALDILRFLAALMVVFHHLVGSMAANGGSNYFLMGQQHPNQYYNSINQFWFAGYIGVQIFFSISGYIISISAMNSRSPLRFMEGRLMRVLPGLWLCTLAVLPIYILFGADSLKIILYKTIHTIFILPFGPYVDGVIWTIVVEMAFYILVFLYINTFERKSLHVVGYILTACSAVYWIIWFNVDGLAEATLFNQLGRRLLLEHGAFFGLGMILAPRPGAKRLGFIDAFFLVLAVTVGYFQIKVSTDFIFTTHGANGASTDPTLAYSLWIFSAITLFISTKLVEKHILKREYTNVRKIGLMTYPLYLIHFTFGHFLFELFSTVDSFPIWLCSVFSIAGAIGLAFLVALVLEPAVKRALAPTFDRIFSALGQWLPPSMSSSGTDRRNP